MSEHFKGLRAADGFGTVNTAGAREKAVAAALTLIHAKVSNSPTTNGVLADELNQLSHYADQIQEALKVK